MRSLIRNINNLIISCTVRMLIIFIDKNDLIELWLYNFYGLLFQLMDCN